MSQHNASLIAMASGIHKRLPFETYRQLQAMNFSRLKEMARSPLQYRHRLEHPKDSTAMRLGSAAHTAILEPHRFLAEYALWDERTEGGTVRPRRGKDWGAFVAGNPGKRIVKADEYYVASAMRDSVRAHKAAMRYLRRGEPEVTMVWRDAETKRICKGRLDWLPVVDGEDVIVGLKTARDSRNIGFGNQAARIGYHIQWAFYADGYEAITGRTPRVVEVVVESAAPHDVAVFTIPPEIIDVGRAEYRSLLVKLAECEAEDEWPGATSSEQVLSFPTWAFQVEDDIADLGLE